MYRQLPLRNVEELHCREAAGLALGVQILFRDVVFRKLAGLHLALVGVRSVFDSSDGLRFKGVAFLKQFVHAFRRGERGVG